MQCIICKRNSGTDNLCSSCEDEYIYDKNLCAYRLKKTMLIHEHIRESRLRRTLNRLYGVSNVFEEIVFEDCKNPKTGCSLRYDFLIFVARNHKVLIEFNGEQHYKYNKFFFNNRDEFKEQKKRDKIKKEYAKKNGIDFIVITYKTVINKETISKIIRSKLKRR